MSTHLNNLSRFTPTTTHRSMITPRTRRQGKKSTELITHPNELIQNFIRMLKPINPCFHTAARLGIFDIPIPNCMSIIHLEAAGSDNADFTKCLFTTSEGESETDGDGRDDSFKMDNCMCM